MLIKIKGKESVSISSFQEFMNYLNSIIMNFNSLNPPETLKGFYNTNFDIEFEGIKNFRKNIKSLFYNKTLLNRLYWTSRGWTEQQAIDKIQNIQSLRSNISKEKLSKMKIEDIHKWKSLKNTNIEFYLDKGYSLEESIILRKKRQRTFSKEICIDKFGKAQGEKVWKERQEKWLKSMSELNILTSKDSSSSFYFKKKFSDDWILEAVNKNFFCNKELLKTSLMNSTNLDTFCDQIYLNKKIYSVNELTTIFNSKLLHDYFDSNKKELKEKLLEKYGTLPTKFGNIRYFNGHICRSNGEFYIANKLYENNISYTYEKKYPNSNLISDFYIEKHEIYVEYLGFLKNDFMNIHNQKICTEYKNRVSSKIQFCKENNIKFIFESDFKLIINKILNYGQDTNN